MKDVTRPGWEPGADRFGSRNLPARRSGNSNPLPWPGPTLRSVRPLLFGALVTIALIVLAAKSGWFPWRMPSWLRYWTRLF